MANGPRPVTVGANPRGAWKSMRPLAREEVFLLRYRLYMGGFRQRGGPIRGYWCGAVHR